MMKLKGKHIQLKDKQINGSKLPKNGSKYISNHAIQIGSKETVGVSTCKSKIVRCSCRKAPGSYNW